MTSAAKRVRVYDSEDIARKMRETFTARPVEKRTRFSWHWPPVFQHVGDSLAVAYSSDKWRERDDWELYKHLAESRNRALCVEGFLRDWDNPRSMWPTLGPLVSIADVPMPKDFAVLALFEEVNLKLFTKGTDEDPEFGRGKDDGVVKVTVAHGHLGGSKLLWSRVDSRLDDQPFLFVYTNKDGPLMIVIGDELAVEADGITG